MKKITVSAPGKLMLLGEHAVVYNHPCIVTAVGQRMFVTIDKRAKGNPTSLKLRGVKEQREKLTITAPDVNIEHYAKSFSEIGKGDIPRGAQFIEMAVKNFSDKFPISEGLSITSKSEFSTQLGFGSSSAATVCTIKALDELFETKLSNKAMFDLSYKTVLDIQKKGSGFDVASAIYGGTLYFVTGGKTILPLAIRSPRVAGEAGHLPLVVGYSGVKADTVTLINKVSELAEKNPTLVENIYQEIAKIVEKAKMVIEKNDWQELGRLMNQNQTLLSRLGVSIDKLDAMIKAATDAGAYGAKLSGAGGGDCMIALSSVSGKLAVRKAIESAGGEVIDVETNVEGARVE